MTSKAKRSIWLNYIIISRFGQANWFENLEQFLKVSRTYCMLKYVQVTKLMLVHSLQLEHARDIEKLFEL